MLIDFNKQGSITPLEIPETPPDSKTIWKEVFYTICKRSSTLLIAYLISKGVILSPNDQVLIGLGIFYSLESLRKYLAIKFGWKI